VVQSRDPMYKNRITRPTRPDERPTDREVHAAPEWQAAMEALILVADLGGPTMFARIGVMRH
jgi:hypothetical protein